MDVLVNKKYKNYDKLSRYSIFPIYYNTLDDRYQGSITCWLKNNTLSINHVIENYDTLDSLALKYYGNPLYYWIIADYNRIHDPFIQLEVGKNIRIPTFSDIEFDNG